MKLADVRHIVEASREERLAASLPHLEPLFKSLPNRTERYLYAAFMIKSLAQKGDIDLSAKDDLRDELIKGTPIDFEEFARDTHAFIDKKIPFDIYRDDTPSDIRVDALKWWIHKMDTMHEITAPHTRNFLSHLNIAIAQMHEAKNDPRETYSITDSIN